MIKKQLDKEKDDLALNGYYTRRDELIHQHDQPQVDQDEMISSPDGGYGEYDDI